MKLVATREFTADQMAELKRLVPDLQVAVVPRDEWDHLLAEIADADVIMGSFGGGSGEAFQSVVRAAPRARWIHTSSAGVDEILCPEFYERDFVLTSGKGESVANLLAEHAMAMLLALTRQLVKASRQEAWVPAEFRGSVTEVQGMTMGIVGYGAVGEALADRARAFGMTILAVRKHPRPDPSRVKEVWGPEKLPELLSQADVVVLILPTTPETFRSIGEAELRRMKPGALLINIGRGHVMDGEAIEKALTQGWVAGAGLDVMPEEPWPADSPLWHLDHVLITPHYAGISPHRAGRDLRIFVENFGRFVRGEPLLSTVSREDRY